MPETIIRNANLADYPDIAGIAVATGQDEEWGGADPAYLDYLMDGGRVVVATSAGVVTGFGATRRIGAGAAAVSVLCDLFVHPAQHGRGAGRAMLGELWRGEPRRMTFSSLHAHALPLYTRFGVDAWWPLLYVGGEVARLALPPGLAVAPCTPDEAAAAERRWTGVDRLADHRAWAARPHGQPVLVLRGGEPLAAGTVAGGDGEFGLVHLALATGLAGAGARDAVLAVLATAAEAPDGRVRVCLPAPHPAVRALFAAGWQSSDTDLFMASDPALLDPRRAVPSPATA